ncbi:MAG TPA: hypothetical protein VKF38_09735 [Anaerolineaceae bacterium]|nr:hypothetical protein [Anaerolineaceae bacterium]
MNTKIKMLIRIIWPDERRGSIDVKIDGIYNNVQTRIGQANGVWLRCPLISQMIATTVKRLALAIKEFRSTRWL